MFPSVWKVGFVFIYSLSLDKFISLCPVSFSNNVQIMLTFASVSKSFLTKIRNYNSALAFASMGATFRLLIGTKSRVIRMHVTSAHRKPAGKSSSFPSQTIRMPFADLPYICRGSISFSSNRETKIIINIMVGIHLPEPVFSHGQLYVAFFRATSREGVKVNVEETNNQGLNILGIILFNILKNLNIQFVSQYERKECHALA